jgi:hypothetical protein
MVMHHYDEFVLCCLPGAFPHVFFLGKGVPTSGSVRKSTLQAWLNHHSMRFEHEAIVIFIIQPNAETPCLSRR